MFKHAQLSTHEWEELDTDYETQEYICSPFPCIDVGHNLLGIFIHRPLQSVIPAGISWDMRCPMPLYNQLSVLNDWATALHGYHAKGVVYGNLTPESRCSLESVDVIRGRGTVKKPGGRRSKDDDDVSGARWAAPELFNFDNGDPHPTKMSDVYSFACLMLQMLTGTVPYCGTRRPEQIVYLKYLGREPIDAQTPEIMDRHAVFMGRCWSPEPDKRPTMDTVVGFIHEEIKILGE